MRLNKLHAANDLLDDAHRLAARYEHDGCLLIQGALDTTTIADIAHEALSVGRFAGGVCQEPPTDIICRWAGLPASSRSPCPKLMGNWFDVRARRSRSRRSRV